MMRSAIHSERPRLLAVFAHPDDETFVAGGTLAKYAARGWDVRVISATYGESGPRGDYKSLSTNDFAGLRRSELQAACKVLGIHPPMFLECADRAVAAICWNSSAKEIARIIRRLRPDVVITFGPDGISGHPDHVALSQIVTSAFWATSIHTYPWEAETRERSSPPRAALYYVLRSDSVPESCARTQSDREPVLTTSVDIGEFGQRKLEAIYNYRSQKHLHPTDPAAIQSILTSPEQFHRRSPRWQMGPLETELWRSMSGGHKLFGEGEKTTGLDRAGTDGQENMVEKKPIHVLAVAIQATDRTEVLRTAQDAKWDIRFVGDLQTVESLIHEMAVDVVISDSHIDEHHSWRDVMIAMHDIADPAALIVTDRHADDALWMQVLNGGGFDLLAKPIDSAELRHAVNVACSLRLKTIEESQKSPEPTRSKAA